LEGRSWKAAIFAEIGEPLSWILGILSITIALGGTQIVNLYFYMSPIFIGIIVGFISHEYMHRYLSRKYHMASRYTANVLGVLITLISSILPIKLLMPGYVKTWTLGPVSRKGLLYSVAGGPITNIVIAIALYIVSFGFPLYSAFLKDIGWVNAYISTFNLIPIPPLDGEKILRLDIALWVFLFILSLSLVFIL
jgi:Zn-dependent proteases